MFWTLIQGAQKKQFVDSNPSICIILHREGQTFRHNWQNINYKKFLDQTTSSKPQKLNQICTKSGIVDKLLDYCIRYDYSALLCLFYQPCHRNCVYVISGLHFLINIMRKSGELQTKSISSLKMCFICWMPKYPTLQYKHSLNSSISVPRSIITLFYGHST